MFVASVLVHSLTPLSEESFRHADWDILRRGKQRDALKSSCRYDELTRVGVMRVFMMLSHCNRFNASAAPLGCLNTQAQRHATTNIRPSKCTNTPYMPFGSYVTCSHHIKHAKVYNSSREHDLSAPLQHQSWRHSCTAHSNLSYRVFCL
jgi:hypothetical protein